MTTTEVDLDAMAAGVTKQGAVVKQMKKDGAAIDAIEVEITKLKEMRAALEAVRAAVVPASNEKAFNRGSFDDLIKRKMYVVSSFEIHGGVSGLFDLGPPSCALKANVLDVWRKHFILEENMLEMECTCLTPEVVLRTSGHVDKFTDLMVKDVVTGEGYRADKLLEDFIDDLIDKNPGMSSADVEKHRLVQRQADSYTEDQIYALFKEYGIKAPRTGNELGPPSAFNLMFKGLFVNFRRLLDYNANRMPFAAAQIGLGFRNEISPRNGLLRVREFCMAEIEHFVNPKDKRHPKFPAIAKKELVLFCQEDQLGSGKTRVMTIGDAVKQGIVNNETLGYFMAKTQLFMEKIGMDPQRLRFRQHLKTEMAHYASDCWDLEIKSSYGWIECVGHADRACYDLQVHSQKSGVPLIAAVTLDKPKQVDYYRLQANRAKIGTTFKQDQKKVLDALATMGNDDEAVLAFQQELDQKGEAQLEGLTITKDMVSWVKATKTVAEEKFVPSVVEPSFGIGRVLYSLLEHSFYVRKSDEQRCVMSFKPLVAPIKVGIYPLLNKEEFNPYITSISSTLMAAGISNKVDASSSTVGRRYSRADELGTPFGITIDYDTFTDESVTLRDRDTMAQIRVPIRDLVGLLRSLVDGSKDWPWAMAHYPVAREGGEEEEDEDGAPSKAASTAATVVESTGRGKFSRPNPPIATN